MSYPIQVLSVYTNPGGNLAASGYYRSSTTQELMNMMPPWMHMRDNPRSIGQQFVSPFAMELKKLETSLNDIMREKFITTSRVDEVDVLYRVKLPSNIVLTDVSASGVRCVAAPSGCSPSGVSQIWVNEVNKLREFYYEVLPTRVEIRSPSTYVSSINGVSWHSKPSGILDVEEKHVDVWGNSHNITWCADSGLMRKQDSETMEDYETYQCPASGTVLDMDYYKGILWCLSSYNARYYMTLASTKTQQPNRDRMDTLSIYDVTGSFDGHSPEKLLIDDTGSVWVSDDSHAHSWNADPKYDYFILDKDNRHIYFKEDYRDSGVFISNT